MFQKKSGKDWKEKKHYVHKKKVRVEKKSWGEKNIVVKKSWAELKKKKHCANKKHR